MARLAHTKSIYTKFPPKKAIENALDVLLDSQRFHIMQDISCAGNLSAAHIDDIKELLFKNACNGLYKDFARNQKIESILS